MIARNLLVLICLAVGLAGGCRAFQAAPTTPPVAAGELPGTVLPASYESPAAHPQWEEEQPTFWERTTEKFKPDNLQAGFKRLLGQAPNEIVAQKKYEEGEGLFAQKRYAEAATCFKKAANRWPDSVLEEDALFMLGESQFFGDYYSRACDTYGNLLTKYGNSRHLEVVSQRQFAIGRYWDDLGRKAAWLDISLTDRTRPFFDTTGNAIKAYESVALFDPAGNLADDAVLAVGNSYFVRSRFEDAGYQYEMLRKEYPQSEHQLQAHLLGLQSQVRSYQGAQYDGKPLERADELITQAMTQFPTQLGDEQERLMEVRRWTRFQRAQRDWEAAEFYYNQKYYRGARFYYEIVVKDFADTPFAKLAQDRLEETRGFPSAPPNHFKWLTGLFPESKKL